MLAATVCLALLAAGCGGGSASSPVAAEPTATVETAATSRSEPKVRQPRGAPPRKLVVKDLIEGSGSAAKPGDELAVKYIGVRYDGSPYTNSWERSKPLRFKLGGDSLTVNPGWEKGLKGMRVGGRRELIVPPELLYQGGAIRGSKPEDALLYVIDLVALRRAPS